MTAPRFEVRPRGEWARPFTRNRRPGAVFRAPWKATLDLLIREVELLGAKVVVLEVDATDADIRRDGMLRANARVISPGVRISFESKHGPLSYATDEFDHWQANVRAIALALSALRAVDRYGVTKSGEQYRGWTAIEAPKPGDTTSAEDAARILLTHGGEEASHIPAWDVLHDPVARKMAYKIAARRTHPDSKTGDARTFREVAYARELLDRVLPLP